MIRRTSNESGALHRLRWGHYVIVHLAFVGASLFPLCAQAGNIFDDDPVSPSTSTKPGENPATPAPAPSTSPNPVPAPADRTQRLPVPSEPDQAAALKSIKSILSLEYSRHTAADRIALARQLLKEADDATNPPPTKYVLLREARDIAAQAPAPDVALESVSRLIAVFQVDSYASRADVLVKLNAACKTPDERMAVAKACEALVDEARSAGKYAFLSTFSASAETIASHCPSGALAAKLKLRARESKDVRAEFDRAAVAARKAAHDPTDGVSAATAGLFLCLIHQDWKGGLPLLQRSPDALLKAAADADAANPSSAAGQISAGDAWLAESRAQGALLKSACEERAAYWYGQAIRTASGLARIVAQRKLEELPGQIKFSAIQGAIARKQVVETKIIAADGPSGAFKELPEDGAVLVGFKTTDRSWQGQVFAGAIQPIYRTASGRTEGQRYGTGDDHSAVFEAEPGYAVGGVRGKGGNAVDGFEIVFMRIKPDGRSLDPADSYLSSHIGGMGGAAPVTLGCDGKFIVGVAGHSNEWWYGFSLLKMP